jgi:hypothetical protein
MNATTTATKRWVATLTTFEPPYQHSQWGAQCIEFRHTSSRLRRTEVECSPTGHFRPDTVETAERGMGPEVLRLFPGDLSWRDVRPLFGEV